jgi:hypothetical protein
MSMVYCHTCDRHIDTDYEVEPCERCLEEGKLWCWMCSTGYETAGRKCPKCGETDCVEKWEDD